MFTHPLTKQLDTWWAEHAQQPGDPEWTLFMQEYEVLNAEKDAELLAPHLNEGGDGVRRFGMSGAGSCTRKAGLKLLGHKGEPFDAGTLWTFFLGHKLEPMGIALLRVNGLIVTGSQEPARIDPFMASFADGIIHAFSDGEDAVLSIKTTGYKGSSMRRNPKTGEPTWSRRGFSQLPFDGVRVSNPSWWVQVQAEMYALGVGHALVLVMAKDMVAIMKDDPYLESLAFYCETIPYDQRFCEGVLLPTWQRQWESVQAGNAGSAAVFSGLTGQYVNIPAPALAGKERPHPNVNPGVGLVFNHCENSYCEYNAVCARELAREYQQPRRAAPALAG